ncbi:hypothetical protein ABE85_14660 [Mitsuaria sp. 7]|nr:hypothetical protein ABE85_14660 [Mitsuaria sp. 7]
MQHGDGRKTEGLDPYFAQQMSRALACLRTDLLLPDEVATRDIALDLLRTAPPDRLFFGCRHWRITCEQGQQLRNAILLGDAILATGPEGHRRHRSKDELAALRDLVHWAGDGGDRQQRAAFVAALRAPEWDNGDATVRWHESAACEGRAGPLDMPPRRLIAALTGRDRTSLLWQTHSFQIDDPRRFAESIAAFDGVTLQPTRIPSTESCMRLPRGITTLDVTKLPTSLAWSDIAPLRRHLPDLRNTRYVKGQLPGAEPAALTIFKARLRDHILHSGIETRIRLEQEHAPRIERIVAAVREQPELADGLVTALCRETGVCLDADVMRLDEMEAQLNACQSPQHPADSAAFFFREAVKVRARQTAADRDRAERENLEIGFGLTWAVDRRLVDLLGLRPAASEPIYRTDARLPGAVATGVPVNDRRAADAVIAAEINEGFPTLAFFASGGHTFSPWMIDTLDADEGFKARRAEIDREFNDAYNAAFDPDDPHAGTAAFVTKETDLTAARVDRLVHHLQPALEALRAAGIGKETGAATA